MKEPVVVDTNILLSALITDSKTRSLVLNLDPQLVAPEAIHREIEDYRGLIREKSGLKPDELDTLLTTLFKYIQLVPTEELEPYTDEAEDGLIEVDQDDVVFLAAALAVDGSIWTDDTDLQQQDRVPVYTISEVVDKVES